MMTSVDYDIRIFNDMFITFIRLGILPHGYWMYHHGYSSWAKEDFVRKYGSEYR